MKDLYQVLGVARDAAQDDIKRSYRKLTQKYHPDKNPGDKAAEERFKDVSTAYEVLGDAERRKLYDEFGDMSLTQGFDAERARSYQRAQRAYANSAGAYGNHAGGGEGGFPGGFHFETFGEARDTSFDDLLSRLFGGGRVRVDDLGGGFGARQRTPRRGGDISGDVSIEFTDALAGVTVPLRIETADGKAKTLDVKVPQGVNDGDKLRLRGQGGAGSPPGDILLTINVKPHARLKREGNDLRLQLPVTAYEAYGGASVDVPTPWGTVVLKLPAGSQNGQALRLKGKGVQVPGKPAGDLFVVLDVRLPEPGDTALLEALERAQKGQNVRAKLGS